MYTANLNWLAWLPHVIWRKHECPRCGSSKFKSAESHSYDGVLAMFALLPVRCTFCWRRFYWFALHGQDGI